jgi:hypothetical protein
MFKKIKFSLQQDGFSSTFWKIYLHLVTKIRYLLNKLKKPLYYFSSNAVIHRKRIMISKELNNTFGGKVKYGPLKEFMLGNG